MQGVTDKVNRQLRGFKTTRKLLTQKSKELDRDVRDLSEAEKALRRGFDWQKRLTEALLKYASAVSIALLNVGCAHEELVNAGAADAGIETAVLLPLMQSLVEAQRISSEVSTRMQRPLEAHNRALVDSSKQVREADEFSSELGHYRDKMDALKVQKKTAVQKARQAGQEKFAAVLEHDAIKRNQVKLDDAERESSAADARARRALEEIASQQDGLSRLARDMFDDVCKALRCVAMPLVEASTTGPACSSGKLGVVGTASPPRAYAPGDSPGGASPAAASTSWAAHSPTTSDIVASITPGYAAALLGSRELLRSMGDQYFRKYDTNRNGVLDDEEAMKLMEEMQGSLGVPREEWPDAEQLHDSLAMYAGDGRGLDSAAFPKWFANALETAVAKTRQRDPWAGVA